MKNSATLETEEQTPLKKSSSSGSQFLYDPEQQQWVLDPKEDIGQRTVWGSVFTLTNTILGSGTLAVPYAIASSGYVFGLLTMTILAIITRYSVKLLIEASELAGKSVAKTYESLGLYALGKVGAWISEFTFIFGGFGTNVSYFIFVSNLWTLIFGLEPTWTNNALVMVACCVFVVLPLSLNRRLAKLGVTSILATFAVGYVVLFSVIALGTVAYYYTGAGVTSVSSIEGLNGTTASNGTATNNTMAPEVITPFTSAVPFNLNAGSVYTVTLLIGAFACHNTALPVYEELKDRTQKKMGQAVAGAIGVAYSLYFVIAVSGYILFGAETKDNILLNFTSEFMADYPTLKFPLLLGRIAMATALLFACPTAIWPFRSAVLSVYLRVMNGRHVPSHQATHREFITVTIVAISLILFCAVMVPSVKTPLSIVGSVSGSLLIFILPSSFNMALKPHVVLCRENRGPLIMFVMGILVGVLGFSMTMYKILHPHN